MKPFIEFVLLLLSFSTFYRKMYKMCESEKSIRRIIYFLQFDLKSYNLIL